MSAVADKDPAILDVLAVLARELGADSFQIVDHWEADLCAIGIASPADAALLVYISTWQRQPGRYNYECETPRPCVDDTEAPYEVAERGDDVELADLIAAIERHMGRGARP